MSCSCTVTRAFCPMHGDGDDERDMHLADVPEPKTPARPRPPALAPADSEPLYLDVPPPVAPALPRRSVLRPEQHEPGFVTLHDRAFERVALVPPEAARRIAVIDTALAADGVLLDELRDRAGYWRSYAEGAEERATMTVGERRVSLEAGARAFRRRESAYLAMLGADVPHAPKVQPSEPPGNR